MIVIAMDMQLQCGPFQSIQQSMMVEQHSMMNLAHRHLLQHSAMVVAKILKQVKSKSNESSLCSSSLVLEFVMLLQIGAYF